MLLPSTITFIINHHHFVWYCYYYYYYFNHNPRNVIIVTIIIVIINIVLLLPFWINYKENYRYFITFSRNRNLVIQKKKKIKICDI